MVALEDNSEDVCTKFHGNPSYSCISGWTRLSGWISQYIITAFGHDGGINIF